MAVDPVPDRLRAHWASWLGATPQDLAVLGAGNGRPAGRGPGETGTRVVVVGSPRRTAPGWDGAVHPVLGIIDPTGRAVVSVPPDDAGWARDLVAGGTDLDGLREALPGRLGLPGHQVYRAAYRWTTEPAAPEHQPDAGAWVPVGDPAVPEWLRPFGGKALVAVDEDGCYLAGVGLKRHDEHAQEIAVGTDGAARGRGLARRLVAQSARTLLSSGVVPTYLHDPDNIASARVAEAAGLPDRGWSALGLAEPSTITEEGQ